MQQKKERLKQQITIQKYFKEEEPRFLTFAEMELIRTLHNGNPEEWTIVKLSESFPVLPQTVEKILRTKWLPRSVDRIMRYDSIVVENWKKFHAGKLPVNPILSKHLTKFKDRKIILTDRESLAKQFVEPKPEFAKPKSQMFSNIIQNYLNEKQTNEERLLLRENEPNQATMHSDQAHDSSNISTPKERNATFTIKDSEKVTSSKELQNLALESQVNSKKSDLVQCNKKKDTSSNKMLTFSEFVKAKLENIHKESSEEGIALLNVYRKEVEAAESHNAVVNVKETTASKAVEKFDNTDHADSKNKNIQIVSTKDDALDTYVKIWNKKTDVELEYAKPIKIAKHLHKPGMSYRVGDCYYDDDGEFLYRVPGVQS